MHPCEFFWDYWAARPFAHDDRAFGVDDGLDMVAGLVADVLDLLLALIALAVSCCLFAVIF